MSFQVNSTLSEQQVYQYLGQIAVKNKKDLVFSKNPLNDGKCSKIILNQNKNKILTSDDKNLIKLFRRAVRNHDTIHPKFQADPVPTFNKHYQSPNFQIPKINVTLDVRDKYVLVTTKLLVQRKNDTQDLILNGRDHEVKMVLVNNKILASVEYTSTAHELIIPKVPEYKEFEVTITSKIDPFKNSSLVGLYKSGEWLTTQCESEGARRIFFSLDRPDVLSRYTTTIIADKKKYPYRISNGNLVEESVNHDGRAVITWNDPFPKPSYLFASVLGDFGLLEDTYITKSGRKVQLQIYVEKGKEQRAEFALDVLKKSMDFDEKNFDREYDLDYLKIVGIPDFNAGAMENKGLLIFNDSCLLVDSESGRDWVFRRVAHVVMHEYAHNWSGNRVTVKNWFEIALKEAFTDFRSVLFIESLYSKEFARIEQVCSLRERQFPQDSTTLAHPIQVLSYVDAMSIYDTTTYVKGREVFRMLKTILDSKAEGLFRKAQNEYFKRYDGKAVTFYELLSTMKEVSGIDLTVFENWFHQAGTPKITIAMDYDDTTKKVKLHVKQSCPSPKNR